MSDFAWNVGMDARRCPWVRIAWLMKGGNREQGGSWRSVFGTRLYVSWRFR